MSHKLDTPAATPVDGIEILVNLAKTGKIDPWNINIVEVTDQFLQALGELKAQDLKLTAKTLLYAAILLRMKSDSLAGINFLEISSDAPELLDDPDWAEEPAAPLSPLEKIARVFESLDQVIRRRTSVKQPRQRKVTLTDLIAELQKLEALDKKRRLRETVESAERRRMQAVADLSSEDIVELAHEEFIEDTILRMQAILERFFNADEPISLTQLETEGRIDRVSAYLAVLFLAARGEVDLHQEGFYTELYIGPAELSPLETLIPPEDTTLELAG